MGRGAGGGEDGAETPKFLTSRRGMEEGGCVAAFQAIPAGFFCTLVQLGVDHAVEFLSPSRPLPHTRLRRTTVPRQQFTSAEVSPTSRRMKDRQRSENR